MLEEAWSKYRFNDSFAMKAGQYKGPFAHESLVSSKKLMAAERTLLNDQFTGGDNFLQGVSFIFNDQLKQGPIRAEAAITDGIKNNANQNFQDFPTNNADFGLEGRVEYFVMGNPKQYEDFEALNNKTDLLVLGGGLDWTEAGNTNFFLQTADVQYENTNGLGLYGAFYGRYTQNAPVGVNPAPPAAAPSENDIYDWGLIAQAGYLIQQKWEPFVRYSFIDFDSDGLAAGVENQVHEITFGVNYFIFGHNAKFTLDGTWLPNGSPVADDGAGILANDGNSEFLIRGTIPAGHLSFSVISRGWHFGLTARFLRFIPLPTTMSACRQPTAAPISLAPCRVRRRAADAALPDLRLQPSRSSRASLPECGFNFEWDDLLNEQTAYPDFFETARGPSRPRFRPQRSLHSAIPTRFWRTFDPRRAPDQSARALRRHRHRARSARDH